MTEQGDVTERVIDIQEDGYESGEECSASKKKKSMDAIYEKMQVRSASGGYSKDRKMEFRKQSSQAELIRQKASILNLNAYDRHKQMINTYFLYFKGSCAGLARDRSKDKTDSDVIREHHQFLWDGDNEEECWEKRLAKKYYDKLYKEYCICDLRYYKDNKVAMRWRTENELVGGKGQFTCGEKHCAEKGHLRTWEVNFGYVEHGAKKNALIKLRLCPDCSYKLNYRQKRKEVTRRAKKRKRTEERHKDKKLREGDSVPVHPAESSEDDEEDSEKLVVQPETEDIWSKPQDVAEKTREDDFESYIEDLFL